VIPQPGIRSQRVPWRLDCYTAERESVSKCRQIPANFSKRTGRTADNVRRAIPRTVERLRCWPVPCLRHRAAARERQCMSAQDDELSSAYSRRLVGSLASQLRYVLCRELGGGTAKPTSNVVCHRSDLRIRVSAAK